MELIVISESQIKLMLTPDDLGRYPPEIGTAALLRGILREAGKLPDGSFAPLPKGFSENGKAGKLYVQMYPSRGGGCELFVTRIGSRAESEITGESSRHGGGERCSPANPSSAKKSLPRSLPLRRVVYRFDELNLLLGCCAVLSRRPYSGESAAYSERGKRRYYLVLTEETPAPGEYLGSRCPDETFFYISEHCAPLCREDAVRKLGDLA